MGGVADERTHGTEITIDRGGFLKISVNKNHELEAQDMRKNAHN